MNGSINCYQCSLVSLWQELHDIRIPSDLQSMRLLDVYEHTRLVSSGWIFYLYKWSEYNEER